MLVHHPNIQIQFVCPPNFKISSNNAFLAQTNAVEHVGCQPVCRPWWVVSVHVLRLKPWIDGKIHWTVMFFCWRLWVGQNCWSNIKITEVVFEDIKLWWFVISTCGCIIPSLKLTVRTWKRMVGRRLFLFGLAQPGRCELLVSGSVYILYYFLDLVVPPLCSFPCTLIIDDFCPRHLAKAWFSMPWSVHVTTRRKGVKTNWQVKYPGMILLLHCFFWCFRMYSILIMWALLTMVTYNV